MAQPMLSWTTVKRKVNDLVPYSRNPRVISNKELSDLKASLKKFNLVELPAVDADNKIIAGHQRLKVLQILGRGEEEIEVRIPNRKLTENEYKQYLLSSNAIHGGWDFEILAEDYEPDFLIEAGMDTADLAVIWDAVFEVEDDDFDVQKELEKIKNTDIKLGDKFALGRHVLICSDATNPETITKLLGGVKVDMINVDPPYNIGLNYNGGIGGKKNYGGNTNDKKSLEEYRDFIGKIITNSLTAAKNDCHAFFWCDEKYIGMLQDIYQQAGISQKRLCLWLKNNMNPTPQVAFNKTTEFCLYGTKGKPYLAPGVKNLTGVFNKEIGTGSRLAEDVMDMFNVWLAKRLPTAEYEHPTEKPPTLYDRALRRCSKPGDTVLDLCAGSGSLMVACEELKRTAYLADIEPIFCQLIINRFEKLTSQKSKKL